MGTGSFGGRQKFDAGCCVRRLETIRSDGGNLVELADAWGTVNVFLDGIGSRLVRVTPLFVTVLMILSCLFRDLLFLFFDLLFVFSFTALVILL